MGQVSTEDSLAQKKTGDNWNRFIKLIKELLREGNERHFIIKNREGEVLVEVTAIIALVFVLAAPLISAIGLIVALIRGCKLSMEYYKKNK